MNEPKNINLYLMDGMPEGRIKCSTPNYPIFVYKIPYTEKDKCKNINELKQSGIYFLIGKEDDKPFVYIGQGIKRDDSKGVLYRACEQHSNANIEFWNEVILLVSSQDSIGATELNYLENRFCTLSQNSNRYIVKNGNTPNIGTFTEEQECNMKYIIENAKILIGALGYNFLNPYEVNESKLLFCGNAKCQMVSDGFMLLKGSEIKETVSDTCPPYIIKLREENKDNIENNVLKNDIFFTSPSSAAMFVYGYRVSGNIAWKNKNGIKLGDIQ